MTPTTSTTPFDIPELLDAILLSANLKMRTLLRLRRVHPKWRTAIDKGSLELRRTLYLSPASQDQRSYLMEENHDIDWDMPKKTVSSTPTLAGYKLVCTAANLHPALVHMRPGTFIDRDCSVMRLSHATFAHWYCRLPATVRQWKYMYITQPPATRATLSIGSSETEIERSEGIRMCDLLRGLRELAKKFGKEGGLVMQEISVMDMAVYDNKEEALGRIETFW